MAKIQTAFRFPQEVLDYIKFLEGKRSENKTEVVIAAITRLYLVVLKKEQQGKLKEVAVIQKRIESIENKAVIQQEKPTELI